MTDKRYTVISVPTPRGPEYRIYDRINDCTVEGSWDCEKWAQRQAEVMEEKWRKERTPSSSRVKR